jgi:predicted nucleic acid-binding protein
MSRRYGIDTSILVRLTAGHPESECQRCLDRLEEMVLAQGHQIFASNQVIGESYIALQHHYKIDKPSVRLALKEVLQSGLVSPLNGNNVIKLLQITEGCGLMDRLIEDEYHQANLVTLSLDKRMCSLPNTQAL